MFISKLSIGRKLGFGVADMGGNLCFPLLSFWALQYLADVGGLPAFTAGASLMVGKLWDAFVDPAVGMLSDRTRTRWGRRRPFLFFAALPLACALALFFWAPVGWGQGALFWWSFVVFALLNTMYSLVNIPYGALTPELTADYNERMSLNGYRFGFAIVGTLLGAALVQPILSFFPDDPRRGFAAVGVLFGVIVAMTTLITAISVREPKAAARTSRLRLVESWTRVMKNRPFRIVLGVYTFHLLGITFLSGMLVYYFKYVLHNEAGTTIALLLLLVVAMVFVPLSVLFSKRFGKVRTYQAAMGVLALSSLTVACFGHLGGPLLVYAIMTAAGIGLGFSYAPPFAMVPDAIELEAHESGKREEGAYYGLWNFAIKLCQAGGAAGSGLILGWSGYVADRSQTASSLGAIQALIGPVPAALFAAAFLLLFLYPIDRQTYQNAVS